MQPISVDVLIVGGGPAGLAAAAELFRRGVRNILILEREKQLGGILRQCIHDGFGLTRFGEALSGPEYAQRFIRQIIDWKIPFKTNASVLQISEKKYITAATRDGLLKIKAQAIILAMGCRERTRGALAIPGERPAGVFTAGVAQSYINIHNLMIGKEVVILGSGDIGMIMARRLTLEGAHVQAVFEIESVPSGLPRNIVQCLDDYNIPLYLNHTVTCIHGRTRLEGVTVARVDDKKKPIPGTERFYPCDTLILSVGLIPENELSLQAGVKLDAHTHGAVVDEFYQTNVPGIFAAGNVLHVHDLVDFVSLEAEKLAGYAALYLQNGTLSPCPITVVAGNKVGHVVPQKISGNGPATFSLRVTRPVESCSISVFQGGKKIFMHPLIHAQPAEMIQFTIPQSCFLNQDPIEICVG